MKKHHYVYYSYEEWGRGYIGCRTCDCLPEEDIQYFGSFRDKTFFPTEKTILFVCETREEVLEIEIELHNFFDVAVNPQFANMAKATNTKFDRTGAAHTEETKKKISETLSGEGNPRFGVPCTEETKKKISAAKSGENNPCYGRTGEKNPRFGVPHTEETKKKMSEAQSGEKNPQYGRTGALNPRSKAIIVIKPGGTQLHFGGGGEAARELKMDPRHLTKYARSGHVLKKGKFKGWQFIYKNSTKIF